MRLDQRDGRAVRLGSRHPCVEVVRFALPPALERALRVEAALRRKRRLPAVAGLGPAGRRLWRWRTGLGEALERGPASAGWAIVRCAPAGVLAGFTLHAPAAGGEMRLAYGLGWNSRDGAWSEDPDTVADRLTAAAASGTAAVCRAAGRFPAPSPGWGAVEARLTGLVVFAPE